MNTHNPQDSVLHSLLFSIEAINKLSGLPAGETKKIQIASTHSILAITCGEGMITIDGESLPYRQGTGFFMKPGSGAAWISSVSGATSGYQITFSIYRIGEGRPVQFHELLPYGEPVAAAPFSRLHDYLERMMNQEDVQPGSADLNRFKQQIALQELLVFLLESRRSNPDRLDKEAAVQQTVAYMVENYREDLTVEKLARSAGLKRWQYTSIFQTLTGRKPLDYLTELRMKRAKELLLLSNDPLREIARSSGFKDEYYFNRRFRQTMGFPPKQYARAYNHGVRREDWRGREIEIPLHPARVVAIGYALGEMIALGIKPLGADLTVIGRQVVYRNKLGSISDVGTVGDPKRIRELQPDLILHSSDLNESLEIFSDIAPTVSIRRSENLFDRLRLTAELFGKKRQAENWIARYESKENDFWRNYDSGRTVRETAAVILQLQEQLFVMGNRGIALTLYHPLTFRPAKEVETMIGDGIPFLAIAAADLPAYAGDRIFLLIGEDGLSQSEARKLTGSRLWQELPAVQAARYHVTDAKWNFDDPITRDMLLAMLPQLLSQPS